jgi:hypothetical protein
LINSCGQLKRRRKILKSSLDDPVNLTGKTTKSTLYLLATAKNHRAQSARQIQPQ